MYDLFLILHNLVRWIVLLAGVAVVGRAALGLFGRRPWEKLDRTIGVVFTSAMDTQLLLGLILYVFLSPITRSAFADFGAAMGNGGQRFFAVEHAVYMIVAAVLAHVGSSLSRRVQEAAAKHQRVLIWSGLALLLVLVGTPWVRPLFRF